MYHELLSSASFWLFLWAVDEDLAAETRNKGCPCGGHLRCTTTLASPGALPPSFLSPSSSD